MYLKLHNVTHGKRFCGFAPKDMRSFKAKAKTDYFSPLRLIGRTWGFALKLPLLF
jgi:hypothetical protein